jgi:predicted GIY-YIG superfamily endonuclease
MSAPTWVYRYFDAEDALLYVGVAFDVLKRAVSHRRHSPWWPLAATYTEERYPTRIAALAAEAEAIRTEGPLFNIVHNRQRVSA